MKSASLLQKELNDTIAKINGTMIYSSKTKRALIQQAIAKANAALQQNVVSQFSRSIAFTSAKRALLIGCNYNGSPNQLYGCIDDVQNVKDFLEKQCGFTQFNVMTDNTYVKPTKQNILNAFTQMLAQTGSNDTAFFQFSGHGMGFMDTTGDENDGQDELIVPLGACSIMDCILDDEFRGIIDKHLKPGAKLLALFDCCHSGSTLDLKYTYGQPDQNVKETAGDVFMISGCTDQQQSMDTVAMFNGVAKPSGAMTFAFLNCIKPSSGQSMQTLITQMNQFLKNNGYSQIPRLSFGKRVDFSVVPFL